MPKETTTQRKRRLEKARRKYHEKKLRNQSKKFAEIYPLEAQYIAAITANSQNTPNIITDCSSSTFIPAKKKECHGQGMEIFEASEILEMEEYERLINDNDTEAVNKVENSSDRCRMCLKIVKNRVVISKAVGSRFQELTQTELSMSDKYPKLMCSGCDKDLKSAHSYRELLIVNQKRLRQELGEPETVFHTEMVNCKQEEEEQVINEIHLIDDDEIDAKVGEMTTVVAKDCKIVLTDCKSAVDDTNSAADNFSDDDFVAEPDFHDDFDDDDDDDFMPETVNEEVIESKKVKRRRRKRGDSINDDPQLDIDVEEKVVTMPNGKKFYVCDYCGKNITTGFSLKEHILTQHTNLERKFACDFEGCGLKYITKSRLRIHEVTHKDDKKAVCQTCGAVLSSKRGLREHIASVHTKTPRYFCDKCDFIGSLKIRIKNHVKTHIERENRPKHACHICGFVSVCPKSLRRHIFEHQGLEFTCHCGKTFNYKGALQMHIRCVHKKIKKHLCSLCGKAFFNKTDLRNHNLTKHTAHKIIKDKPCEICGKLYALDKQLERHRLYHNIRYSCEYDGCDEYFNTEKRMQRHMKSHEVVERLFCCQLEGCDENFGTEAKLKRHMKKAHD